jgi:hypothetical protein
MTKFRLPGLIVAWTAAAVALGWSNASACQGPAWHGNIFFSEQGLPEVDGTVAAHVQIVDRPPSGGTVDTAPAPHAVVAHVTKVMKGKIDQDYVVLETPLSSCDSPPGVGEKGLIIGYARTDSDARIRIAVLSESPYGFQFRINERTRACPMPQAAADALIVAYGTHWGEIYSPVSTAGLGKETRASRVVVESGSQPIYAILGSSEPLIWKIEGDTARIDRVILVTRPGSASAFTSAVVGVPKDRIGYLTCLPVARGGLEQDTLAHVVRRELGRIDKIVAASSTSGFWFSSTYRVSLPSLATADISSSPARIPGFEKLFDISEVNWIGEPKEYDVAPGKFGIASLLEEGRLVELDKIPDLLKKRHTPVYKIVKPVRRLPAGDNNTLYVLGSGIALPHDPRRSCIFLEETGKLAPESSGHAGCMVVNMNSADGRDPQ